MRTLTNFSIYSFLGFIALSVSAAHAGDCEHSRKIERVIAAENLSLVDIQAGAGALHIAGDESRSDIEIYALLCAENKDDLRQMDVASKANAERVSIETRMPKDSGWTGDNYASIDLSVKVPARMMLEVKDSSGEALVEKVRSLVMIDSSGKLEIEHIDGDVKVTDSSGELRLEDIKGNVEVNDSSGAIKARDVTGTFHVIVDSSGEIDAKRIGKDVIVDKDSSGSITVRKVGGDFIVRKDGSGGIDYKEVAGKVDIPQRKQKY
jgi:hypothetical protein